MPRPVGNAWPARSARAIRSIASGNCSSNLSNASHALRCTSDVWARRRRRRRQRCHGQHVRKRERASRSTTAKAKHAAASAGTVPTVICTPDCVDQRRCSPDAAPSDLRAALDRAHPMPLSCSSGFRIAAPAVLDAWSPPVSRRRSVDSLACSGRTTKSQYAPRTMAEDQRKRQDCERHDRDSVLYADRLRRARTSPSAA